MELKTNEPKLAKVKKVSVINNGEETSLKIRFVYYATEFIHGCIKDEEVRITTDHPLYEKLAALRCGDELYAIPDTNEITKVWPHKWWFRWLLRCNKY